MLRTLDAIHLVSAMGLDLADANFVTYDKRLTAIATELGRTVVAPS